MLLGYSYIQDENVRLITFIHSCGLLNFDSQSTVYAAASIQLVLLLQFLHFFLLHLLAFIQSTLFTLVLNNFQASNWAKKIAEKRRIICTYVYNIIIMVMVLSTNHKIIPKCNYQWTRISKQKPPLCIQLRTNFRAIQWNSHEFSLFFFWLFCQSL